MQLSTCAVSRILAICVVIWFTPASRSDSNLPSPNSAPGNTAESEWFHIRRAAEKPELLAEDLAELHINPADGTTAVVIDTPEGRRIELIQPAQESRWLYRPEKQQIDVLPLLPSARERYVRQAQRVPLTLAALIAAYYRGIGPQPNVQSRLEDGLTRHDIRGLDQSAADCDSCPLIPGELVVWTDPATGRIQRLRNGLDDNAEVLAYTYGQPIIADIYALGIPRDTVLRDRRPGAALLRLHKRLASRMEEGFGDHAAVLAEMSVAPNGKKTLVNVSLFAAEREARMFCAFAVHDPAVPSPLREIDGWPRPPADKIFHTALPLIPTYYLCVTADYGCQGTFEPPMSEPAEAEGPPEDFRFYPDQLAAGRVWPAIDIYQFIEQDWTVELLSRPEQPRLAGIRAREPQADARRESGVASGGVEQIHWFDTARDDILTESYNRSYEQDGTTVRTEFHTECLAFAQLPDSRYYPSFWRTSAVTRTAAGTQEQMIREFTFTIIPGMDIDRAWFLSPKDRHVAAAPMGAPVP